VDSGSTDDSVTLAKLLGAHVVRLDLSIPFTAARARNEGFAELMQLASDTDAVQFVDGDCEIVDGWIGKAKSFLTANPRAAVVCGRRRERYPDRTIYNRLCDLEWNTPTGNVKSCGGDALIRVEAFKQVSGYNDEIIAGEEPEMCVRLRAKGWEIHRIDQEMTLHDAAMTQFSQWWKRNVRAGHAYAEGFARHGYPPANFRAKEVLSNFIWGMLLWWALPLLALRIYLNHRQRMNANDARNYALFVALSKVPQMCGQLKFRWNRWRGKKTALIEYKRPAVVVKS